MIFSKLFYRSKNKLEKVKALKDDVAWVEGFTLGFSKAWDMMAPLMTEGVIKMKQAIRDEAINATLNGLESVIEKRILESGNISLQSSNLVLAKKREFESKIQSARTDEERKKYSNYLETINWVLNGNLLPKT